MPTAQAKRLIITGGDGAWLTSSTGHRLLDATGGLWHANIGHGREEVARAAYDQMTRLETYHVFGRFANEPALTLADRLAAMAPIEDAKVMLTSGGSDSVDLACKLARRHWQLEGRPERRIILSREGAYHGLHAFGTSIAGLPYNREGFGTESLIPETARIPTNDIDAVRELVAELGADRIAAVIAEPVLGTGGVIGPADGYLEGLQALRDEYGILLIADEVITGFGRTGRWFGLDHWNVVPDLMIFAKGITSGYLPLSGVMLTRSVHDTLKLVKGTFAHAFTYSGHPTECAVGLRNLQIIEEEHLVERAAQMGAYLQKQLKSLYAREIVGDVRGIGLLGAVELVRDRRSKELFDPTLGAARRVWLTALANGVIVRPLSGDVLGISPPFVISEQQVDRVVEVLDVAIASVEKELES
jgi:adenosylmethionine-8-amino-7-oxononanoate aminotransferase